MFCTGTVSCLFSRSRRSALLWPTCSWVTHFLDFTKSVSLIVPVLDRLKTSFIDFRILYIPVVVTLIDTIRAEVVVLIISDSDVVVGSCPSILIKHTTSLRLLVNLELLHLRTSFDIELRKYILNDKFAISLAYSSRSAVRLFLCKR